MNNKQKVIDAIKRRAIICDRLRDLGKKMSRVETDMLNAGLEVARQIKNVAGGEDVFYDGWIYGLERDCELVVRQADFVTLTD